MPDDERIGHGSLADILARHIGGRKQTDVARDAGLAKATLHRWLNGTSVSPYHWDGLLQLLATLGLSRAQASRALRAAGLPSIDELWTKYPARRALLARWQVRAPNNLPAELTSFVGRDDEVATLAERLSDPAVRLVTLTGPGGSGKTRLSLRIAAEVLDVFADGVTFVGLADVSDPDLVMPAIGAALGLAETAEASPAARVAGWLAGRRALLVLDNLEQVTGCEPALAALLRAAPGLTILATSRVPLLITGEHRWPVRPLPVPPPDLPVKELAASPAVDLFAQRARAAEPAFALTAATAPDVARLCARLDGLPLAIELVAARAGDLGLSDLVARVPDTLSLASDGPRDVALRQQALRETIAWSERLLPPPARLLFARLGMLYGWDESLAVAVGAGSQVEPAGIPALLGTLEDASLIERLDDATPRYRMLATIREYALERLDALGEREATAERHARAMLALAKDAPSYIPQSLRDGWFLRIDRERANFDAALEWTLAHGETLLLARLTAALWPYWQEYRYARTGRHWLAIALDGGAELPPETQATLLTGSSAIGLHLGSHSLGIAHATEALALWREIGNPLGLAHTLQQIGWAAMFANDIPGAIAAFEAGLEQWEATGDPRGIGVGLADMANALTTSGQFDAALPYLLREQAVVMPTGDPLSIGRLWNDFGLHALLRGDIAAAIGYLRDAVAELEAARPSFATAIAKLCFATTLCITGQLDEAEARYRDLLDYHELTGDRLELSLAVLGHAAVAHRRGQAARAAWLCGVASMLQRDAGIVIMPGIQAFYEGEVQLVRDQIGDAAFAAAFTRGAAMPVSEALAAVRDVADV